LAALDQPGITLDRYYNHLDKLAQETRELHAEGEDTLARRLDSLSAVIAGIHTYRGDTETYDDLQNASLIRVIDRRRGLPITLAILYIHVARALGWGAHGLNLPGHFVARLDKDGERAIFDPFNGARILQAADLRQLVKTALGPKAELSADYYNPASSRAILIRLQNNIKTRLIATEDYEGALRQVEIMRDLDPAEYRLLLDAGVLYARAGQAIKAAEALEDYIARAPHGPDRSEAVVLLRQIRQTMN
jgi:regulator of sirC expression with transglutaminase-like and TPR domain